MNSLDAWAAKWGVSSAALADLATYLTLTPREQGEQSEAAASVAVRLEAARAGILLWRNNVGALQDAKGRWVRYGLANDSKQLNEAVKSGDLIGIKPVRIEAHHVGSTIGQFVSREMKHPGWHFTGTDRERAQQSWAMLVQSRGGDAGFACGPGSF